jgi:transcriptional regulator with XRE-family HTH domain
MSGGRLRQLREARGLTQGELASRAGVSRQLVGAIEVGRHLPRVDAGVGLARALGVSVEELFGSPPTTLIRVHGDDVPEGVPLRVGRVGDSLVCDIAGMAGEAFERADAVWREGSLSWLPDAAPATVVTGCDPALGLLARLADRRRELPLLAVPGSTGQALAALAAGRVHAGLVHGPADALPAPPAEVRRVHVAAWRVGLAAPRDAPSRWWREALEGTRQVAQRDEGAASQAALVAAAAAQAGTRPVGPVVSGHVEAARLARREGIVALTIEPAAIAADLAFHPLEEHVVQLWIAAEHAADAGVTALGDDLVSAGFRRRVEMIGGYDLRGSGTRCEA